MEAKALKPRIRRLRDALVEGLVERDESLRLIILAALAGEHSLLLGPPGTAKSELARRLHRAFRLREDGGSYFERLLTRFTVPEELFGPLSIAALEKDTYLRKTERYLPTASIAFIDEIFKANSAILNALLTLLNEREFDNGSQRGKTPLVSVVGASNELPKEEELAALYDRFLVRYQVRPVSSEGFDRLLDLRGASKPSVNSADVVHLEEVEDLRRAAEQVQVPTEVKELLKALRPFLAEQKIPVSDRRWRKIVSLLQTSALTDGRNEVSIWDCWLIQHCAWQVPEQRQIIADWYYQRIGAASPSEPERLTRFVTTFEDRLKKEQSATVQAHGKKGELMFLDPDGKDTLKNSQDVHAKNSGGALLYLSNRESGDRTNSGKGYTRKELEDDYYSRSRDREYLDDPKNWLMRPAANTPKMVPLRYSIHHIEGRVREMEELLRETQTHVLGLERHMSSLKEVIDNHIWIPLGFSSVALEHLKEAHSNSVNLQERAEVLKKGFVNLPREGEDGHG